LSTVFDLAFFNALVRTFLSHCIFWIELVGLLVDVVINFALNGYLKNHIKEWFEHLLSAIRILNFRVLAQKTASTYTNNPTSAIQDAPFKLNQTG